MTTTTRQTRPISDTEMAALDLLIASIRNDIETVHKILDAHPVRDLARDLAAIAAVTIEQIPAATRFVFQTRADWHVQRKATETTAH